MFQRFSGPDVYRRILVSLLTHFSMYVVHIEISKTFYNYERREHITKENVNTFLDYFTHR